MNKNSKFHSPDGPAFNEGEVWISASGSRATILYSKRWGPEKWDVDIFYTNLENRTISKNAWSFQVRYVHQADYVAVPRFAKKRTF